MTLRTAVLGLGRVAGRCRRPIGTLAAVSGGVLTLAALALHSGYPLVYSDTGTYLLTGYGHTLPWDRPMTYGLFLRGASLGRSPWAVVFTQCLILSWVMWCVVRRFTTVRRPGLWLVLGIGVLTYTTAVGVTACHLQPDVFSAVAILCLTLLLFASSLSALEWAALATLLVLSNAVSMSHLATTTAVWLLSVVLWLWEHRRPARPFRLKRLAVAGLAVALSWLAIPSAHLAVGAGFRYPEGGPIFFMGRLSEAGVLIDLLAEECPTFHWRICDHQDAIPASPDEFLWKDSAFTRTGGATPANLEEYRRIMRIALTRPRWLGRVIQSSGLASLRQLTLFDSGSWIGSYAEDDWLVVRQLRERYPSCYNDFLRSRQRAGQLDFRSLDGRQYACALASIAVLLPLFAVGRLRGTIDPRLLAAVALILAGVVVNAVVCGGLNTPSPRYQNRLVFLIPTAAFLLLAQERLRAAIAGVVRHWIAGVPDRPSAGPGC